jgi:hypothetical protein
MEIRNSVRQSRKSENRRWFRAGLYDANFLSLLSHVSINHILFRQGRREG